MRIRSEIKAGLIGIAAMVVLIWGIHFLKGENVLRSTYILHTCLNHSEGIQKSAPILYKGMKIGYVENIKLGNETECPVLLTLAIKKNFHIRKKSLAELFSSDIMGTKAIRIIMGSGAETFRNNDTIPSHIEPDLIKTVQDRVVPLAEDLGQLALSLNLLAGRMDSIIGLGSIPDILENLSMLTSSLKKEFSAGGSLDSSFTHLESFTGMLAENEETIESMLGHLESVSSALDSAGLEQLGKDLQLLSAGMNVLIGEINSGDGTAGKLIYTDSLHHSLLSLITNLDSLVKDLGEHPEDYVQFSLFGKSGRKK